MRLAFTGTQRGMTRRQLEALYDVIWQGRKRITEFHHGDCIGADAQAHDIVATILGVDVIWIHPPENPNKRAWKQSPHILPVDGYLDRNRTMVTISDGVIAAPKSMIEEFRGSGTWMTIREARDRQKKPLKILEP